MIINKKVFYIVLLTCLLLTGICRITSGEALIKDSILELKNKSQRAQFIHFGLGEGWFSVRDESTSPLIYNGVIHGAEIGFVARGKKLMGEFNYNFSYGHLVTRNYPTDNNKALAYDNCLNTNIARKVFAFNNDKTSVYMGGNVNVIGNFRSNSKFDNARFNYELFAAGGPIIYFNHEICLKSKQIDLGLFHYPFHDRNIGFSSSVYIPLTAGIIRPSYSVINDFVNSSASEINFHNLKYVSFKSFFGMEARAQLNYNLSNKNMLRFSYNWYYYNYHPGQNNVKGTEGIFLFSFLFRLNK